MPASFRSVEQALTRARALAGKGETDEAMALCRAVLERFPDNGPARERLRELEQRAAAAPAASDVREKIMRLQALYRNGALNDALTFGTELARHLPGSPHVAQLLGAVQASLGQFDEAEAGLARAVSLKPDMWDAHYNRGILQEKLGRMADAAASFEKVAAAKPDFVEAHFNLANVRQDLGEYDSAMAGYARALELKPNLAGAHHNLGYVLNALGRPDDAIASYRRAIAAEPVFTEAHLSLSALTAYAPDDAHLERMRTLRKHPGLTSERRVFLDHALAKACEDIGEVDAAFAHLAEANRLRKRALGYDIASDEEVFGLIRAMFADADAPTPPGEASARGDRRTPIFVLGMPRSGTTLVEQILASHGEVVGGGERRTLNAAVAPHMRALRHAARPRPTAGMLQSVREAYLSDGISHGGGATCFTDKMPLNFRWIGFVANSLPEAKIVHVSRHPIATCWSCYKHYFRSAALGFVCDLDDLVRYYRLYLQLMDDWRTRFPGRIYDLDYERLTEDQEGETRKLLAWCGLDWDERCLAFHDNAGAVGTLSASQVRKRMYRGSSRAWKAFEPHLKPLVEAFGAPGGS
jgi:tetratricopeptide (TPR) repeat protein